MVLIVKIMFTVLSTYFVGKKETCQLVLVFPVTCMVAKFAYCLVLTNACLHHSVTSHCMYVINEEKL